MSKVPTPREAAEIRLQYPPDTRIELKLMVDAYAVPPGTRGTVDHVDDMGNVHTKWDNGRTLSAIPGVDSFRKLTAQETQEEQQGIVTPQCFCEISAWKASVSGRAGRKGYRQRSASAGRTCRERRHLCLLYCWQGLSQGRRLAEYQKGHPLLPAGGRGWQFICGISAWQNLLFREWCPCGPGEGAGISEGCSIPRQRVSSQSPTDDSATAYMGCGILYGLPHRPTGTDIPGAGSEAESAPAASYGPEAPP